MWCKEFRDALWRVSIFVAILIGLLIVIVNAFPLFEPLMRGLYSQDTMADLLGIPPEQLLDFGIFARGEFYVLDQWQGKTLGQLIPIFVLLVAFPIFSREQEKRTIYFLLSGWSRTSVYWVKYGTGFLMIAGSVVLLNLLAPLFMNIAGYPTPYSLIILAMGQQLIAAWFLYSLFLLVSIRFSDQVRVMVAGGMLIIVLPFLSFVPALSWLNIYPYILGVGLYDRGGMDLGYSIGLSMVAPVCSLVGARYFATKEVE
jgi:hypothetical protein